MSEIVEPRIKEFVIKTILNFYPRVEILAFGSRISGNAQPYSDLDIAIHSKEKLSEKKWIEIEEVLENSDIPFKIDLIDLSKVSDEFRKIILDTCVKWV